MKAYVHKFVCLFVLGILLMSPALRAAEMSAAATIDPQHLLRFSSVLDSGASVAASGTTGITFTLYSEPVGGAALWMETQNVAVDAAGHYSVLLGAQSTGGLPAELLTAGNARWLGVQVAGAAENRVPLANVPYAVQAGDAQALGGRAAAEYALASQLVSEIRSQLAQAGYDIASVSVSDALPRGDAPPAEPGPPPSVVTLKDLDAKLVIMDGKLNSILNNLNNPPLFSFTLCTQPSASVNFGASGRMEGKAIAEGKLGADAYGNGVLGRILAIPGFELGGGVEAGWDVLSLGICFDIGAAAAQGSAARPAREGGEATQQLYASAQGPEGAAITTLVDQIKALDKQVLQQKLLGLASSLKLDPAKLVANMDKLVTATPKTKLFDIFDGGDNFRTAMVDTLPLPDQFRTALINPASAIPRPDIELRDTLCKITTPTALRDMLKVICDTKDALGPLVVGIDKTVKDVSNVIDTISSNVKKLLPLSNLPAIQGIQPVETAQAVEASVEATQDTASQ